jgi:NhaP-type Na+/H+ or K+/H+ antiporter
MPFIMILYYLITLSLVGLLAWNLIREKKNLENMILYLLVLIPLIMRLLRVK